MTRHALPVAMTFALVVIACGAENTQPALPKANASPTDATEVTDPSEAPPPADDVSPNPTVGDFSRAVPPTPAAPPAPPPPRIGSVSHYTWIYRSTNRNAQPIGYVMPGTSVTLESSEPLPGSDCASKQWFAVKPTGFVCDDATITQELESDLYRALANVVQPRDHALPYRYGYSTGAPMFGRFPADSEIEQEQRTFGRLESLPKSGKPRTSYEELAAFEPVRGTDDVPSFAFPELPRLRGYDPGLVRKVIPSGSLLSFARAVESNGRTYLLTPDLTLVPADRVRPFRETSFHGVALGGDIQLPIGWTRSVPRSKYSRRADGEMEMTSESWPPRTMLPLTGASHTHRGKVYYETREGPWIRGTDVSVVKADVVVPSMVREGERWIEFSSRAGTLTAYVGRDAVYSTLASPGRGGGAPSSKMSIEELVQGSFTPLGAYRISFKTRSTTMTPEAVPNPQKHWIQDVPYTQYLVRPFAIHAAYWHEDFGMPKSGGCINLSPIDAQYLFGWTEPAMPEEWSGVTSSAEMGLGTLVLLKR